MSSFGPAGWSTMRSNDSTGPQNAFPPSHRFRYNIEESSLSGVKMCNCSTSDSSSLWICSGYQWSGQSSTSDRWCSQLLHTPCIRAKESKRHASESALPQRIACHWSDRTQSLHLNASLHPLPSILLRWRAVIPAWEAFTGRYLPSTGLSMRRIR